MSYPWKSTGLGLVAGASMLALTMYSAPASAADLSALGGDCCADLEERIAELEATTARKGNRKVSLEVYGQVTTGVMWWETAGESNVYVVDPQTSGTRFGMRGKAAINSDVEAGYWLELQWQTADATQVTRDSDEGPDIPEFRQSHWYINSKTWGKVRVGHADTANSGIAEIDLSNASIADAMSSSQAGLAIIGNSIANGGLNGPVLSNFEFNRQNIVRYDTPTIAGFVLSTAWGEDDIWDVALRYAGEFAGFKVAAGIAYGESTDRCNGASPPSPAAVCAVGDPPQEVVNGGFSILHLPTGLFVTGSAGQRDADDFFDEEQFWFVSSGIERKWFTIGDTTLFGMGGEYEDDDDATAHYWGLGAVQQIDAAAMDLFLSYRHYDLDSGIGGPLLDDEFDTVVGGARIKF